MSEPAPTKAKPAVINCTSTLNPAFFGDTTPNEQRYLYTVDSMTNTVVVDKWQQLTKAEVQKLVDSGITVNIK